MKPALTLLLLLAALVSLAVGQIRFEQAVEVSKDDPIYPFLAEYQATVGAAYKKNPTVRPVFSSWIRVDSPAAARLFPQLRFASVSLSEMPDPKAGKPPVGLAYRIETTLAVNLTTKRTEATLPANGNYEAFGKMLVDRGVPLRDEADANTIWEAFCELHHRHWKDYPAKKVSASEWHLGLFRDDQILSTTDTSKVEVTRTHYMKVVVDPTTSHVSSWESLVDTSEERTIPKG